MNSWENEPDEWQGEMCLALRHSHSGHWCGYIAVPKGHPWFGKGYDEIDPHPEVHGGLTYAKDHSPRKEPDGNWWLGFDCAHLGDLSPRMPYGVPPETYRDLEYVKREILGLLKQAVQARRTAEAEG